ncbi:recombinase family protein [Nitrospira sp. Nam80]
MPIPKLNQGRAFGIDEDQATWVRQIFAWYVDGKSPRWMAGQLNRSGIPAPGVTYRRKIRPSYYGTWSATVLHGDIGHATGMPHQPVYIGRLFGIGGNGS